MRNIIYRNPRHRSRQQGAITMFSAVLILILLTEMILYAVQVGVFEQRKSSNEMKQKLAFHTADSAIQVAKQFMSANATLASSAIVDKRPGTDGWLAGTAQSRWQPCSAIAGTSGVHPCFGEPVDALRAGSYYYSFDDDLTANDIDLPLDLNALTTSTGERVRMHALLCMLDIDRDKDPIVQGCTTDLDKQDSRYFLITLLARGEADCDNNNCGAEALIAEKIGSFGPGGNNGGPGAPLTSRTNVPLSGTVEIVANPNGGGTGVPISSWVNARTGAPTGDNWCVLNSEAISPVSGSYGTCEAQEFYGVDIRPDDYKCPGNTPCSCNPSKDRMLTYAQGATRNMGIDIVEDPNFPCDLWDYSFGLSWEGVRDLARDIPGHSLTNCDSLDEFSDGLYWISGPTCDLKDQIGGKNNPVLLISAAADTRVSAGAELFGVLFVTNKEVSTAQFTGNGTATIYGAAVMDGDMKNFNGTFQIVYVDNLVNGAYDTPLFGAISGGWTDFHRSWE